MQRAIMIRFGARIVPAYTTRTLRRNYSTPKPPQNDRNQPKPSPAQPKAPVEEPSQKPRVYTRGEAPSAGSQSEVKSNDTRHKYAAGVQGSDVQGEAEGVQQERARDKETVKPSDGKEPRARQ